MNPIIQEEKVRIVLVCVGVFQEYIFLNLTHLVQLGHTQITVITDKPFFDKFNEYIWNIELVDAASLNNDSKLQLDKDFRDGFWIHTSMRFFYLYEYMKREHIKDVIHIENDVLIYHNADVLLPLIKEKHNNHPDPKIPIYLPFDCYDRSIASIVYIPTAEILGKVLDKYDGSKNDMENFANIRKMNPGWIDTFPIFPQGLYSMLKQIPQDDEIKFTCRNYEQFGGFIFDAAAMGQYLGGIDARNAKENEYTIGFVNETCVIKYKDLEFVWREIEHVYRPYLRINELEYPIFNLHFHSKQLHYFILYN